MFIGPRVRDRVVIRVWLRCAFIDGGGRGFGLSRELRFLSRRHRGRGFEGSLSFGDTMEARMAWRFPANEFILRRFPEQAVVRAQAGEALVPLGLVRRDLALPTRRPDA